MKGKTVSLNGYEIEEIARPLKEALAICQCVEDAAANVKAPYIVEALSVAVSLLLALESNMDGLLRQTDKEARG